MNVANTSSQCDETYATDELPLWKEIQIATKDINSGGGNVHFLCKHCECTFVVCYTRVKAHLLKLVEFGIRRWNTFQQNELENSRGCNIYI